jgi:glycosyltransferase involved in cell wall biosynthesis
MKKINVLSACKLMPYYRIGVFSELSKNNSKLKFYFYGDTKSQGGIKQIPFEHSDEKHPFFIRWVRTKNYFHKPERLLWQTGIIEEIFKSKFQVFIFEGAIMNYPVWLYAFLFKIFVKKILFWTHGNRGIDKGIKKILRKILFKYLSDGLLLYGNLQRNNMIKDGYEENSLHVIYNSLLSNVQLRTIEKFNKSEILIKKKSLFKNYKDFTMLFIGRLVKHKKIINILDVLNDLKLKYNVFVNVIFIGEGPERKNLESFINSNDLINQVYFAGPLYNEIEIAPLFLMSNLMISPGNVGLNCIHSLAYGVPVLTHNNFKFQNPEVESIVEGETGYFYNYNDKSSMTNKVLEIIKDQKNKSFSEKCINIINNKYNEVFHAKKIRESIIKTVKK